MSVGSNPARVETMERQTVTNEKQDAKIFEACPRMRKVNGLFEAFFRGRSEAVPRPFRGRSEAVPRPFEGLFEAIPRPF
jgi:hypothetical protein